MRHDEACRVFDELPKRNPCYKAVLVGNAVAMLAELRIAPPAWTIPARSWLVVVRHDDQAGSHLIGTSDEHDRALIRAFQNAGHYRCLWRDGKPVKRMDGTLYTYACPIHRKRKSA